MAWTNKLTDQVMPFMIQWLKDYSSKVDLLILERKEALQAKVQVATLLFDVTCLLFRVSGSAACHTHYYCFRPPLIVL